MDEECQSRGRGRGRGRPRGRSGGGRGGGRTRARGASTPRALSFSTLVINIFCLSCMMHLFVSFLLVFYFLQKTSLISSTYYCILIKYSKNIIKIFSVFGIYCFINSKNF